MLFRSRIRDVILARGHDIYGEATVEREVIVMRARVAPGDSGAPLVGSDGRVLGLVFAASADGSETGYALTSRAVAGAAETGRMSTREASVGQCLPAD